MTLQQIAVVDVQADRWALSPTLQATLSMRAEPSETIHALLLQCQVRVEPGRRSYDDNEAALLLDLFGERTRWADTVKPFRLASVPIAVAAFTGETETTLTVPLSFDLEVAAGKYFAALGNGEVPLLLLFSGTAFTVTDGRFRAEPVPWTLEAQWRLPVSVWRDVMDLHFPDQGWVRVDRRTLQALTRFRSLRACTSWDETIAELIAAAEVTS